MSIDNLKPTYSVKSIEPVFMEDVIWTLQEFQCNHDLSFVVHTGLV